MTKKKTTDTVTQPVTEPQKQPGSVTVEATLDDVVKQAAGTNPELTPAEIDALNDEVQGVLDAAAAVDPDEAPAAPTLVEQIREQRKLADLDLDTLPVASRTAFAIAKGNALEVALALEKEFARFVDETSALLFLDGPPKACKHFGDLAVKLGPVVLLDCNDVYAQLAEALRPSSENNGFTFGISEYSHLVTALATLGSELDLINLPRPRYEEVAFPKDNPDALVAHVRRLIELSMDSSLLLEVLKRERFKQALAAGFDQMVPVVILNANPAHLQDLKQNLLRDTSRAMSQTVTPKVTASSVEETLVKLAEFAPRR